MSWNKNILYIHSILIFIVFTTVSFSQSTDYNPPLYWSVYEHHIIKEQNGVADNYIPETEFLANIDWVDQNLKSYGYDMICVDGWGDVSQYNDNGYRSSHSVHWQHDFEWWSNHLQQRGMRLGMYGNPLWIHVDISDTTRKIATTNINVSTLIDSSENSLFTWVQVDRPGAEEYVKGYIQYYADMGIKFFRVDFLSWYETGYDRYLGIVGPNRPRVHYETALQWMREACDSNDMYLSLVMPNLFNEAELEIQYGHMIRINEDTGYGEWWKFSDKDRGHRFDEWSQYANAFDGFTYWSYISGRDKVRLDGDFIRINTFSTDSEKRSVISAHLIAGGPLTISDQHSTIDDDIWVYQNEELLELNYDGFVGKPITNNPIDEASQIWTGQMSNGDWVIGLFNRESETRTRTISLNDLGFSGDALVRDLWQHAYLGLMDTISADIPPHGCMILKVNNENDPRVKQNIIFEPIADKVYGDPDFTLNAQSSSGLPVEFETALGPAFVNGNQVHLTGQNGKVFIVAKQAGDESYFAAMPKVQSFQVTGGHQSQMYIGGTFSGWNLNIPMQLNGDNWIAEDVQISGGGHELKFANTNDWSGDDWGNASGLTGTAQLTTGGAPNISFVIPQTGLYDIYFNDISLAYSIESVISDLDENVNAPLDFELSQNYPNPFNPATTIKFGIPASVIAIPTYREKQSPELTSASVSRRTPRNDKTNLRLIVYDILGNEIAVLINEQKPPGNYKVEFNASSINKNLASGIYIYKLTVGSFSQSRKMLLLK
jgi:hypothetical protein